MTEILLLGTFHFHEEKHIDFFSEEVQNELKALTERLSAFKPNAVAVEITAKAQADVDRSYAKFDLSDLSNREKMKRDNLGELFMYGEARHITYNCERVQVGYRLAKMSGHNKVYAVDDDTRLDMGILSTPKPYVDDAANAIIEYEKDCNIQNITDMYKCCNSDEWSRLNHEIYMKINMISTDNNYAGADLVAKWYERNLRIFSNIQRLAKTCERVFVIYGAGHLQILRDLINADSNLKLIDVIEYL